MDRDHKLKLANWLLGVHCGHFKIADKFEIPILKKLAEERLLSTIQGAMTWDRLGELRVELWKGPQYPGLEELRKACIEEIQRSPTAALEGTKICDVLQDHGAIAFDVAKALAKEVVLLHNKVPV